MPAPSAKRFRFSLAAVFVVTAVIGLITAGIRALVKDESHVMLGVAVWYLGAFNLIAFTVMGNACAGARGTMFAAVLSAISWFIALCMVEMFESVVISLFGFHALVVAGLTVSITWPLIRQQEPESDGAETAHHLLEQRRRGWPPPEATESEDPQGRE